MTKLAVKDEHRKYMCHDEIELFVQSIDIVLASRVSIIGKAYVVT
jgi:hypothetical protein